MSTHVNFRNPWFHTEEQVRDALKERDPEPLVTERNKRNTTTNFPGVSVTSPLPLELNHIQQQLNGRMLIYLQAKASGLEPHTELLLLYGGPGVGKTHNILAHQLLAEIMGNGVMVCTPTGAAATNISRGQTIYSTFGFRVHPNDITSDEQLPLLSAMKVANAKLTLKNKKHFSD